MTTRIRSSRSVALMSFDAGQWKHAAPTAVTASSPHAQPRESACANREKMASEKAQEIGRIHSHRKNEGREEIRVK